MVLGRRSLGEVVADLLRVVLLVLETDEPSLRLRFDDGAKLGITVAGARVEQASIEHDAGERLLEARGAVEDADVLGDVGRRRVLETDHVRPRVGRERAHHPEEARHRALAPDPQASWRAGLGVEEKRRAAVRLDEAPHGAICNEPVKSHERLDAVA